MKKILTAGLRELTGLRLYKETYSAFRGIRHLREKSPPKDGESWTHFDLAQASPFGARRSARREELSKALEEVEAFLRDSAASEPGLQLKLIIQRDMGLKPPPDDEAIRAMLESNLRGIVQTVGKYGAKAFLLGYPSARGKRFSKRCVGRSDATP